MENIEVAVRIRPQNEKEAENNEIEIWSEINGENLVIPIEKYDELIKLRKIAPGQKTNYTFSLFFF